MNKVGLLVDVDHGHSKYVFNMAYFNYAKRFSDNVVLIGPYDTKVVDDLDLLIIPGGADVLPMRYKEAKEYYCGEPNWNYEWWDINVLHKYIRNRTPIFGICRGLQTLNVSFGGSLHQHIIEPSNNGLRSQHVHSMKVLHGYKAGFSMGVNSLHHQAIKSLATGFSILGRGYSKEKKSGDIQHLHIEAIKHDDLPIAAVQFHPEELFKEKESYSITDWVDNLILSLK